MTTEQADDVRSVLPRAVSTVPVPDPTTLTSRAVREAIESFRLYVDTRLEALDAAGKLTATELRRLLVEAERRYDELLEATRLADIASRELFEEKFNGISLRFAERDVRTTEAAAAAQKALDAALLAAAALVAQQNDANTTAANLAQASTTKQIDGILALIQSVQNTINNQFEDAKERITRAETLAQAVASSRVNTRQDNSQILTVISVVISALTVAAVIMIAIFKK